MRKYEFTFKRVIIEYTSEVIAAENVDEARGLAEHLIENCELEWGNNILDEPVHTVVSRIEAAKPDTHATYDKEGWHL
jgi:hypothetical protein